MESEKDPLHSGSVDDNRPNNIRPAAGRGVSVSSLLPLVVVLILLGVVGYRMFEILRFETPGAVSHQTQSGAPSVVLPKDHGDALYIVGGARVQFSDGVAMFETGEGSLSTTTLRIADEIVSGDVNGDGAPDVVLFITEKNDQDPDTYYYLTAALRADDGWIGANAIFLEGAPTPGSVVLDGGAIVVTHAAPGASERMKRIVYDSGMLRLAPERDGQITQ